MTHFYLKRIKIATALFSLWAPPLKYRVPYLIYRGFNILVQYCFLLSNFIYMGQVWGDVVEMSEGSYLLFTQATSCLKFTTFLINKNTWNRLLSFLDSDIFATLSVEHEKILARHALNMWRLYFLFMTCDTANCLEWTFMPLFDKSKLRAFPFKLWMPIDPNNCSSVEFYVGYGYQIMSVYLSASAYLTIDYVTVSMIMYAAAQLEIIVEKIKLISAVHLSANLTPEDKNTLKHNNEVLNECIEQHQTVMRFVEEVENMFNVNVFSQLSSTVAIICIIGIHITTDSHDSAHFYATVNYLVTILAQLYMYCWCGNELTHRSQVLRDTLYTTPWYEQDQRFCKTLKTAMECMKRPIIVRVGYYIPLSRPTFVTILRCSYSYFAVLNQANNN